MAAWAHSPPLNDRTAKHSSGFFFLSYTNFDGHKTTVLLSRYNHKSCRVEMPSAYISITSGFLFLVIVEGLAAMNDVMLDGFNDVIALDYMIGK